MPSVYNVIERWLDTLERKTAANGRRLDNLNGSNVWAAGNSLYSYGRHFPLAEYYPASRGRHGRRRPLFLINGDRSTVSTTRHQSETRGCIARRLDNLGAERVIIPFSALDAAGISRDTVMPLEILGDRWLDEYENVPLDVDLDNVGAGRPSYKWDGPAERGRVYQWRSESTGRTFERVHITSRRNGGWGGNPTVWGDVDELRPPFVLSATGGFSAECERDENGAWRVHRRRHLLGGSVFTALVRESRTVTRRRPVTVRDVVKAAVVTVHNDTAALQRAREIRGANGPRRRLLIQREGDPLALLRDPLALLDVSAPISETETETRTRRRRFISSFDANEPAPLYFLATLPRTSRAATVDGAILDLAPRAVHAAMARGRNVLRQGDIFAIETDMTDADMAAVTVSRARLTQWTRDAKPRKGEVGYAAPLRAAEKRRLVSLQKREYLRLRAAMTAPVPSTDGGARRRFRKLQADAARMRDMYRRQARRAILRNAEGDVIRETDPRYPYAYRPPTALQTARDAYRRTLEYGGTDSHGYRTVRAARDAYRHGSGILAGRTALQQWDAAGRTALQRLRPLDVHDGAAWQAYRDRLRAALSVYGTSHSATEIIRAKGGAVYMRGVMRHEPSLERGRGGTRDHVPLPLGNGTRWYLAVRNTVPRNRDGAGRRR